MIRPSQDRAQIEQNHDMLLAACRGDFARMKECIENGARVNAIGAKGMTALLYAAAHKNLDACTFLVAHRAEVNHQNDDGQGVLHLAAKIVPGELPKDYLPVLQFLVDAGAKIESHPNKVSPLFDTSAMKVSPKIVPLMVRAGADPNQPDAFGETPLVHVARGGLSDVARELLHYPIDVDAKNRFGETVLLLTMRENFPFTALTLIEAGANIDTTDNKGKTAEYYARIGGHDEVLSAIFTMRAANVSRGTTKRVKLVHRINVRR